MSPRAALPRLMARTSQLLEVTFDGQYRKCTDKDARVDVQVRDADGVEFEQPGEQDKIKAVSEQFNRFQMMNFNEHMHCLRGTHLKTQGVGTSIVTVFASTDWSSV